MDRKALAVQCRNIVNVVSLQ